MLPPPGASRQNSYAFTLPRPSKSRHPSASHTVSPQAQWTFLPATPGLTSPTRTTSRAFSHGTGAHLTDDEEQGDEDEEDDEDMNVEGRGLEETLEKLGFGAYQWRLLALCGFGWMSDNSALQCIAVILPRVQVHFDLSSEVVGLLSASTMAGVGHPLLALMPTQHLQSLVESGLTGQMMIGAVGWGVVSDLLGRALPFNATLFLTAVFGISASFSPNFLVLCMWMFFLGSAVGGSMPTDGTLFLENLPYSKQYLLTLLSVFFSLGAVLSSVVSYVFLPGASCKVFEGCDIAGKENDGWRRVLLVLGCFNLLCSFARWGLFRLQESPRYLVSRGRPNEAMVALRAIATYNDTLIDISCADVQAGDENTTKGEEEDVEGIVDGKQQSFGSGGPGSSPALDWTNEDADERSPIPRPTSSFAQQQQTGEGPESSGLESTGSGSGSGSRPSSRTRYDAVGVGPAPLPRKSPIRQGSAFYAPTPAAGVAEQDNAFDEAFGATDRLLQKSKKTADCEDEIDAGGSEKWTKGGGEGLLRSWWTTWSEQIGKLFVPQWRRTVILMWIIWGSTSYAYTMFNVWLPAVLESRASGEGDAAIKQALMEFVLYSLAGCPGSLIGAWMIQTSLGRRKSLAICTLATGLSTFAFIVVRQDWAVISSSMLISTAATAMYAVLYGMTPETFGTKIRGTACGTSAALSRLTGVIAPVSAGFLLTITPNLPVFASATVLVMTAMCALLLPFERLAEGKKRGMTMAH